MGGLGPAEVSDALRCGPSFLLKHNKSNLLLGSVE